MRIREIIGEIKAVNDNTTIRLDRQNIQGETPPLANAGMPKMYVDLSDVDPYAADPFRPIKDTWPMGGFDDQSYVMSNPMRDPRHRGKGVANDNARLALIKNRNQQP